MKIRFLIVTLMILLTGCGEDSKAVLKNVSENMRDLESYHMILEADLKYTVNDSSFTMYQKQESDVDLKNGTGLSDETMSLFGYEGDPERFYKAYSDNKVTTYAPRSSGFWDMDVEDYVEPVVFGILDNAENVKKIDKDNYEMSLTEEQIKELFSGMFESEKFDVDIENVNIAVTLDNKYVTKTVITMPITMEKDGVVSDVNVKVTCEFSKFNEVTVILPEEIITSTIEDYIWKINFSQDDETMNSYTNIDLEYDGPKPSKVDVVVEEGYVTNGIIELKGYQAIIVDGEVSELVKINYK